jgi:putative oxidoreductase
MSPIRPASWQPQALSVLRIVVGFTFFEHGLQKVLGLLGGHAVPPLSLPGVAGWLEGVGGLLILIGLFTRPAAFILCGEMAVAYFKQHASASFWPVVNRGELAVLYCFIFLYMFVAGPGRWSADVLIRKKG